MKNGSPNDKPKDISYMLKKNVSSLDAEEAYLFLLGLKNLASQVTDSQKKESQDSPTLDNVVFVDFSGQDS